MLITNLTRLLKPRNPDEYVTLELMNKESFELQVIHLMAKNGVFMAHLPPSKYQLHSHMQHYMTPLTYHSRNR